MKRHSARLFLAVAVLAAVICPVLATRAANSQLKEVVVVFKTHFDIGYTALAGDVLTRYRTTFVDGAMKLIEDSRIQPEDQRFVWTVPGWPLEQMLWREQTPERREKILRTLKEGRSVLHALPFTTHTESLDLEDLTRGLVFSSWLTRENGLPLPRAAKMTDVPEHTWVMPTLLRHAGVEFFHIGCNGGSTPMSVPPLFWWEGPDGSRLLTSYSVRYGTGLIPPDDWPYRTWLALIMTGDNHGPPTAAEVDKLLKQAARELPGVKIKFGTLEDFYSAMLEEKDRIPVVRGDMPDTWIHGLGSMPLETKLAWNVRPQETAVGVLDTELRAAGLNPSPLAASLAKAYENSLLYSEHTFGFDSKKAGGWRYTGDWEKARANGEYTAFEQSFDAKRGYIQTAAQIVTNAVNERMQLLAQNVRVAGPRIVVFNPLPWKRSGEVVVKAPGETIRFFAADVPPSGYKTFKLPIHSNDKRSSPIQSNIIENQFFRLTIDAARGCIASLRDLKTGRELAGANDDGGLGQYLHERFAATNVESFDRAYCPNFKEGWMSKDFGKPKMPSPDKSPYARITLTNWAVSVQENNLGTSITLACSNAAPLAKAVSVRYTLCKAQPYLDIEWAVDGKTPTPLPEGGWICLPFAVENPTFRLARLGSIIDPAKDIIDGGNRQLFCLNSGLTVTGADGFGIGLCPLDSPLVSLDTPGLWKFSLHFVPKRARVFVNLYNNQWDTNFPLWQEGSWTSRIRLWVVRKSSHAAEQLLTPAWEARSPLLAAFADGIGGKLAEKADGFSVSRQGVLVTSFGQDPYSSKTLLRLWNLSDDSSRLKITLPAGFAATGANPVNLRGEPEGKPIGINKRCFEIHLPAFAPASFVFDLDKKPNTESN